MRFVARCCAIAALRRWPCSLRPPGVLPPFTGESPCVPAARLRAYRMYLIALFSCSDTDHFVAFLYLTIRENHGLLIIRRNSQNISFICLIPHFSHKRRYKEMRLTVRRISLLWHKIIGRLSELKAVYGSEQRDLRLIMQVIVHMEMCIPIFIIITA